MSGIGTAAVVGLGAATTAFGAITVGALRAGGDLEQSLGGIETLFKDSADIVIKNAERAYLTAGVNANDYMQQVTSFSASLLQSLEGDTEAAAKAADMAVIDMADNANKMGSSVESIQLAYQGFAKQNYTMLDNLKLGFGGTKTEMERLLVEAGKISGMEYDITNLNDVYSAVHVIQTELGITGTTALEGMETLNGAAMTAKAAWSNFLSGAGGIEEVTSSVSNLGGIIAENLGVLLPRLATGLQGIFTDLLTKIGETVPVLKPLTDGVLFLAQNMDKVLAVVIPLTAAMVAYRAVMAISGIITAASTALNGMTIAQYALNVAMSLNPIGIVVAAIAALTAGIIYLWNTNEGFRTAIIGAWSAIKDTASTVWKTITNFFTVDMPKALNELPAKFLEIGGNMIMGFWNGIKDKGAWLKDKITGFFGGVVDNIKSFFGIKSPSTLFRDEIGKMLPEGMAIGIAKGTPKAIKAAKELAESTYESASTWIEKYRYDTDYLISEEVKMWQTLTTKYAEGTDQRKKIDEELLKSQKKLSDERKRITEDLASVENKYQDALENRAKSIFNTFGLFDALMEKESVSGQTLTKNLEGQVNAMRGWSEDMNALAQRGISEGLVAELQGLGPNARTEIDALSNMTDDELTKYAELWEEKHRLAKDSAIVELQGLRAETNIEINGLLADLSKTIDSTAEPIGVSIISGIIDGVRNASFGLKSAISQALTGITPELAIAQSGFDIGASGIGDSSSYETIEYSETAEIQSQASVIADIISQTLYGGLALIADTIFNSLPDKVDLNINGQTLVEATWDDSSNVGNRRGQLFAPTESEIRDIAMSAIGSLGGI